MRKRTWHAAVLGLISVALLSQFGCKGFLAKERSKSHLVVPVPFGPPPLRKERAAVHSKPGHIWVGGYWEWLEITGTYRWRPGHFIKARRNWEYRRAAYVRKNGRWYYIRPHWRKRKKERLPPRPTMRRAATGSLQAPPPAKKKRRPSEATPTPRPVTAPRPQPATPASH